MTYWIQHITIFLIVPPYLIYTGGRSKYEHVLNCTTIFDFGKLNTQAILIERSFFGYY